MKRIARAKVKSIPTTTTTTTSVSSNTQLKFMVLMSLVLISLSWYFWDPSPSFEKTTILTQPRVDVGDRGSGGGGGGGGRNVSGRNSQILSYLYDIVYSKGTKEYKRIGVAYNSCLDLIVRAQHVIQKIITSSSFSYSRASGGVGGGGNGDGIRDVIVDESSSAIRSVLHNSITSKEHLVETFRYSFEHGSAVERFIENEELCHELISVAQAIPDKTFFIGGNAALMGVRFAAEGSSVLLGGVVGEQSLPLIPEGIQLVNQNGKEEIHLIMEFSRGDKWETVVAPRDNRLIVHCDYSNSRLNVLENFRKELKMFQPDLLVLSGLHLLEREDPQYRTERLKAVVENIMDLSSSSRSVPVHLELASIYDLSFLAELGNTILPYVDSLGLNEQELGFLYLSLSEKDIHNPTEINKIKAEFKSPTVSTVSDALAYIFNYVHNHIKIKNNNNIPSSWQFRNFGRIHFHYLKYHIVAQKAGCGWKEGNTSVAAGSLIASLQSCQFDKDLHDPEQKFFIPYDQLVGAPSLQENTATAYWKEGDIEFYLAPVLVCLSPSKTVGLGDAISSMGLLYHRYELNEKSF